MILYSIVPAEIVFGGGTEEQNRRLYEAEYLGQQVQVEMAADNEYRLIRVFSTQPEVYLNPKLQPGTIVSGIKIKNSQTQRI